MTCLSVVRRGMAVSLVLVMLGATSSQAVPDRAIASLRALPRSESADWQVSWNEETGAPISVYGSRSEPLAATGSDVSEEVRKYLLDHGDLFGVGRASDDCRLERVVEMDGIRHYHMEQTYRGLPVLDGVYNVSVDAESRIVMVTGSARPGLSGDVVPSIGPMAAVRFACRGISGARLESGTTPRLVVRARGALASPAYEVRIVGSLPTDASLVLVDARSGEVFGRRAMTHPFDGLANAYPVYPTPGVPPTEVVLPRLAGDGSHLTGTYVTVHNGAGADMVRANGDFRVPPEDSLEFAQAHAYYHADRYLAFLRGLGYSDPTPVTIETNACGTGLPLGYEDYQGVHLSRSYKNAAYDAGVIAHEVQHFVTNRLVTIVPPDMFGPSEPGAIHEGLSEYFQAAYTLDGDINVWSGGDASCGSGSTFRRRSVINDGSYFRFPNYNALLVCGWPQPNDHTNGLILAGGIWDLRARIGANLTNQLALQAIPFLPHVPTMGCYFDALCEADHLFHSSREFLAITIVRANRYLNCKPKPQLYGAQTIYVGEPATYTVGPNPDTDCGYVPYFTTTWQRRPFCPSGGCVPWNVVEPELSEYTTTETVPNVFELRAYVFDTWGRCDTTYIQQVQVFYPLSVAISGPQTLDLSLCQPGHWTSTVSGHAPLQYRWEWQSGTSWHTIGTASSVDYQPNALFPRGVIRLTVTDAEGQSKYAGMPVALLGTCGGGGDEGRPAMAFDIQPTSGVRGRTAAVALSSPALTRARLEVVDVTGRRVAVPYDGWLEPGSRQVEWTATTLPSGVYFYRLVTPVRSVTKRFVLIR